MAVNFLKLSYIVLSESPHLYTHIHICIYTYIHTPIYNDTHNYIYIYTYPISYTLDVPMNLSKKDACTNSYGSSLAHSGHSFFYFF